MVTPVTEDDLCGHATLASAMSLEKNYLNLIRGPLPYESGLLLHVNR